MTLIYPSTDVIMYADTLEQAYDEARQYGMTTTAALERLVVVTPSNDASVALSLDPATPWCKAGGKRSSNLDKLAARFGEPKTVADAIAAQNTATVGAYRKGWQNSGTKG